MTTTIAQPTAAAPAELLDARAAAALLSVSPSHLYRMADGGRCPPPIRLGSCVRWRRAEILSWIEFLEGLQPLPAERFRQESFGQPWDYQSPGWARRFFDQWCHRSLLPRGKGSTTRFVPSRGEPSDTATRSIFA